MCASIVKRLCLITAILVIIAIPATAGKYIDFPAEAVTVYEVIDGDTFSIYTPDYWVKEEGDSATEYLHRVRLIGVNTPEHYQHGYDEATAVLEELLPPGTRVRLTADIDERDGASPWRWLAYAQTLSCDDVGAELLRRGVAVAWRYLPNCTRADQYRELMAGAFEAGLGVFDPELEIPAVYVASDEEDVYHRVTCESASRIDGEDLVAVYEAQMLVTAGKLPCPYCLPPVMYCGRASVGIERRGRP